MRGKRIHAEVMMLYDASAPGVGRINKTGTCMLRSTFSAILPKGHWSTPWCPCVAMTMTETFCCRACSTMVSAALPERTTVWMVSPRDGNALAMRFRYASLSASATCCAAVVSLPGKVGTKATRRRISSAWKISAICTACAKAVAANAEPSKGTKMRSYTMSSFSTGSPVNSGREISHDPTVSTDDCRASTQWQG